jgi:hypothetical protein
MTSMTRTALAVASIVTLTVTARMPFLLRGDRFFAADEAVTGLMARHVLQGEFPLFFWGQAYKGVPEVYAAAAVFSVAGSSVLALQAVTLAFFAVFIGLQFVLISRVFSPPVAWLTSLFAIVAPPSLVYWSLVGVAEISVTLLAGATAVLAAHAWRQTKSVRALAVFAFAIGFGLWVQQYMLYYMVAIAVAAWIDAPREHRSTIADLVVEDGAPRWVAVSVRLLLAGAIGYAALGLHSFFTGGFTSFVFGMPVENIHPQKLWRISAVLFVVALSVSWWRRVRRRDPDLVRHTAIAGGAFLVGFSPYIVGRLRGGGAGAPMRSANAVEMWEVTRRSANEIVPILFGFRGPGTESLQVPAAMSLALVAIIVLSYAGIRRSRETGFFHVFPLVSVALFLVSVSFVDAQSFRYLMPIYAAVPLMLAVGVREAWRANRVAGFGAAVLVAGLFAVQEIHWYRTLAPDERLARAIACLREGDVRYAWADYWTSYKLTFLTNETSIVAPTDTDRYPPFAAAVAADRHAPTVVLPPASDSPCDTIVRFDPR